MLKNCENCGGQLVFSPKDKGNKCNSCTSVFPVEYRYKFNKKSFDENVVVPKDELAQSMKNIKCKSCGANILLNKYEMQSICPYCGTSDIHEGKKTNLMYIDSIIPFSFGKAEALTKFKATVRKRFYADKKIFKNVSEQDVHGAYINTFVFDMNTSSHYSGILSYTEQIRDKNGETRTITKQKHINGIFDKGFKNITVEANSNLNQSELAEIMPFEYASAVNFEPDFMHGYMLEYQDRMFNDCVAVAEKIIKSDLENEILRKYHCDRVVSLDLQTTYSEQRYNYCLLPVYFVSQTIKDKKYKALMNGQTGKVGSLPMNRWKLFLTVLLTCGILVAVILFFIFAI